MSKKSKRIAVRATAPPPIYIPAQPLVSQARFGDRFTLLPGSKDDAPKLHDYRVISAWDIQHTDSAQVSFAEVSRRLGNTQTLFHGTPATNIQDIAAQGLQPGKSTCMFGAGIYMGEPKKAFGYTDSVGARFVIKVQAALGRVLEAAKAQPYSKSKLAQLGFDSVAGVAGHTTSWGGTLRMSEWVAYCPAQVLAIKVYEYQYTRQTVYRAPCEMCEVLREKDILLPKGSSAFRDILRTTPCGREAYTQLLTNDGTYWVCASCAEEFRLKIGSTFKVRNPKSSASLTKSVRITGVKPQTYAIRG